MRRENSKTETSPRKSLSKEDAGRVIDTFNSKIQLLDRDINLGDLLAFAVLKDIEKDLEIKRLKNRVKRLQTENEGLKSKK